MATLARQSPRYSGTTFDFFLGVAENIPIQMQQKTMHRRSSILKFFCQLLAQEETVEIRSARSSTLFCHSGQGQLIPVKWTGSKIFVTTILTPQ